MRVYFTTRTQKHENGRLKSLLAYVDLDKNNLFNILKISEKPILDLGKRGHFDEFGTYLLPPIRMSSGHIRAYYVGVTCPQSTSFTTSIGLAESYNNGVSFQKVGVGPIFGHSLYDPFTVSSPKIRKYNNKYYLYYTSGTNWLIKDNQPEPIYKLKMATSNDGLNWNCFNNFIIEDILGENEAQACPDVFYKNAIDHMFFCYRGAFNYRKIP